MVRALRRARPDIHVQQVSYPRAPMAVRERVEYVPAFVISTGRGRASRVRAVTGRAFKTSAALARWYDRRSR